MGFFAKRRERKILERQLAADQVQFRIEWGITMCNETTDQLLVQLRAERAHLSGD